MYSKDFYTLATTVAVFTSTNTEVCYHVKNDIFCGKEAISGTCLSQLWFCGKFSHAHLLSYHVLAIPWKYPKLDLDIKPLFHNGDPLAK